MLDPDELRAVAARFGVGEDQVRRDHLVSHVLAALPALAPGVVFFGGTALARTHLPHARLSEDVDLIAPDRPAAAERLAAELPPALRREYPRLRWDPPPDAVRDVEAARLLPASGLSVRVQLLRLEHFAHWPTEERPVDVRYSDVPPTVLRVPTLAAFVAMKASAWERRRASRDLYDLWALATQGAVDREAAEAFLEGTGARLRPELLDRQPSDDWTAALGHQTSSLPSLEEASRVVREALAALDTP